MSVLHWLVLSLILFEQKKRGEERGGGDRGEDQMLINLTK